MLTLAEKSAAFSSSLPPAIAVSLVEVVETANCYYTRRLTAALIRAGVVQSEMFRSRLQLAFPVVLATRFLPDFFPAD